MDTPQWLTIKAAQYQCPQHSMALVGALRALVEVRTGMAQTLRKVQPIGKCPEIGCAYWLEINLDYTLEP